MREIRKFDDILDNCLERLLLEGETIEQCLQSFPEHSDELRPLLETAMATRQASAVEPRPEFREQARYRFRSALREKAQKKGWTTFNWSWRPQWVATIAVILVIFLTGGSTVAAASNSMPDSPLYPVKRATEQAQLAITFSELGKAELHAKLADKRVTEIVYLADKGKPDKIAMTTESLNTHLTEISLLVAPQAILSSPVFAPMAAPEQAEMAVQEAPPAEAPLRAEKEQPDEEPAPPVIITVPPETPPVLAKKAAESDTEADKTDSKAKLKTKVEDQASNNIARLRALLETAPESARPALLRAIEISEAGYEQAIESLDP